MNKNADLKIRNVQPEDISELTKIYNHYIQHSGATFAEKPVDEQHFVELIEKVTKQYLPFLVVDNDSSVIAYAYASLWKERSAYRYSVESSVYVSPNSVSMGIGNRIYADLIGQIKQLNRYHLIIGGITLPNDASIALHESLGFEKVAHFKEIGYKFGQWLDVGYWTLKL